MLLLTLLLATAGAELSKPFYILDEADNLFKDFVQKYDKVYEPMEYQTRLDIFKENLRDINDRNARHPQTLYSVNFFSDLMLEERWSGVDALSLDRLKARAKKMEYPPEAITAPDHFDWRDHGVVTNVKNQKKYGSCFIFGATGVIEGQYAIYYNKTIALSEQQALDCMPAYAVDSNCFGGWPEDVCIYFENGVGLVPEKDYPYEAKQGDCKELHLRDKSVTVVNSASVHHLEEEHLKQLLYEFGPLGATLDFQDFYDYKKGIAYPIKCSARTGANLHEVLLVGYGRENGTDYWIIKNSFGTDWGENGYLRLVRGMNACGVGRSVLSCTIP